MMKKITPIALILLVGLMFSACRKEEQDPVEPTINSSLDLQVAEGFTWKGTRDLTLIIGVETPSASGLLSRISVFTEDPASGASAVVAGSAGYGFEFRSTITVPASLSGLWLQARHPNGNTENLYLAVSGSTLSHTFTTSKKSLNPKTLGMGPDCSEGCDHEISGNTNVTITGGKTYCVTGSYYGNLNFDITGGGGTLRVCGTATPQNINQFGNNCRIDVCAGGTFQINSMSMQGTADFSAWPDAMVTIGSLNINHSTNTLNNFSDNFTISNTFSPNGYVNNYGTMNIGGSYNGNGILSNGGILNVSGSMTVNNEFDNYGTLSIGGDLNFNSNVDRYNSCKITVGNSCSFNAGSFTMTGGYLKAGNSFVVNGQAELILENQSMLSTKDLTLNNDVSGSGSMNSILTSGIARINGNKNVSGAIEWADNDGQLAGGGTSLFINGASFTTIANAQNTIPVSDCNPEGIGGTATADADGDGVSDATDDYPNDASKAYNNFYPSETTWSSLAFEDLWPSYGDFDMNDLVVNIRFNRITNAQNKVVQLVNLYQVKAVGGTLGNGFAFQLDPLTVGSVASVTGSVLKPNSYIQTASTGIEAGTTKPVIPVWDDVESVIHRAGGVFFNTEKNAPAGTSDLITITVSFSTPLDMTTLGTPPYNHFMIKGMNRAEEIHMAGFIPTSKANTQLFGTGNDATNPASGKYYLSKQNLAWSIFVAEEFDYPVEKSDIIKAHLKFAPWAQSSGSQLTDWYKNKQGYRDPDKIYK